MGVEGIALGAVAPYPFGRNGFLVSIEAFRQRVTNQHPPTTQLKAWGFKESVSRLNENACNMLVKFTLYGSG